MNFFTGSIARESRVVAKIDENSDGKQQGILDVLGIVVRRSSTIFNYADAPPPGVVFPNEFSEYFRAMARALHVGSFLFGCFARTLRVL